MLLGQEGRAGSRRGSLTPSQEDASEPQGGGLWMQGFGGLQSQRPALREFSWTMSFQRPSHQLCSPIAAVPSCSTCDVHMSKARSPANKGD